MTRIMLAFLALLTGLVATGAPAATRVCSASGTEVGSIALPHHGERAAQRQGAIAQAPQPERADRHSDCRAENRTPVYVPTVQLGIDRAHE